MTAIINLKTSHSDFANWLSSAQSAVDAALAQSLSGLQTQCEPKLFEALDYVLLAPGKRLRPLLVLAVAQTLRLPRENVLPMAIAIEMIHAYSLVHDDLPCMDDDALRRGKPTCHIRFNEALAVLVGDALQTLAFETLANADAFNDQTKVQAIATLAKSAGASGMVAGQAYDIAYEGQTDITLQNLETLHRAKTGALIQASMVLPALAVADSHVLSQLSEIGAELGLYFQVQDDCLDVESSSETLGKPQGSDQDQGKATFVSLLGLDAARDYAAQLFQSMQQKVHCLQDGEVIEQLVHWVAKRSR